MSPSRREGWKDIAAYFGVGVRTVQVWEAERNLPVKRMPGPRGRVYADVVEMEEWRLSLSGGLPKEAPRNRRTRWPAIALVSLSLVLISGWWYRRIQQSRQPSDFLLAGTHLAVLDQNRRTLFQHDFNAPVFPTWELDAIRSRPLALDVNGDGDREFLFPWRRGETPAESDQLLCFCRTGRLLWSFRAGRPVHSGKEPFELPFRIAQFARVNLGGDRYGLVITAHHHLYYPTQVSLIGTDGHTMREYWHSGQWNALLATDFNADGLEKSILEAPPTGRNARHSSGWTRSQWTGPLSNWNRTTSSRAFHLP